MKSLKKYLRVLALLKTIDVYKADTKKGPTYKYAEIGKALVAILGK